MIKTPLSGFIHLDCLPYFRRQSQHLVKSVINARFLTIRNFATFHPVRRPGDDDAHACTAFFVKTGNAYFDKAIQREISLLVSTGGQCEGLG